MPRYADYLIERIRYLRIKGNSYGEIQKAVRIRIPKSSLSYICRNVRLPDEYIERIQKLSSAGLSKGRLIAVETNRIKREKFFRDLVQQYAPTAKLTHSVDIGKIALSMLCLGEASKYNPKTRKSFSLGNSDPRIIVIFIRLLRQCFPFDINKMRATVQCRADQDPVELKRFWIKSTGIPEHLFYKPLIDNRTIGKPTKKHNYMGVLRIDYFDTKVQLELECLADLIYNQLRLNESDGPVAQR